MKTVVVIPARMGSSRFPGKPLVKIAGKTMIQRCWELAKCANGVDEVFVATEDTSLLKHVESFGGKGVLTSDNCVNGTERVAECIKNLNLDCEIVINFQGDTPVTPPWIVSDLAYAMRKDSSLQYATPAVHLSEKDLNSIIESKKINPTSGKLVVFDKEYNAMYFSSTIIPHLGRAKTTPNVYRHIGMYAFRKEALFEFVKMEPTYLEQVEQLEQLRLLENGKKIKVVIVDYKNCKSWSVDHKEDVEIVENIIKQQGELV